MIFLSAESTQKISCPYDTLLTMEPAFSGFCLLPQHQKTLTHYALVATWNNFYFSSSSRFSHLRAFTHIVVLSGILCLSHPPGLQPYKLSVADLDTFQVSAEKSNPPEGLL